MLRIKRVYEKRETSDGKRIYVDRLWPRGLTKEAAAIDEWLKDLSPSDELRKWFGHLPDKFPEFRQRYIEELSASEKQTLLKKVASLAEKAEVTMLYSAKDTGHNNAVVLYEVVSKMMRIKSI